MFNVKSIKRISAILAILMIVILSIGIPAYAANEGAESPKALTQRVDARSDNSLKGVKAMASALAIGLPAAGGAIAMGIAIARSVDGISRQPEAEGKIRTSLMLGLVFIETAIIYALIVAILVIFVL